MRELSKTFDFKNIEGKWVRYWQEHGLFHARPGPEKRPYTIVIPPPNVTGILHMGHALNNTLQDIIVRYKRMRGFEVCWMPGTDHAGIATQNVVEKNLAKEQKTRQDLGREQFLKEVWDWKERHGSTIIRQLEAMGSSCDWTRERFTMDDAYSEAVTEVFIRLYKKGLVYRGERIINWCPRCHTALSDEEAEHRETRGALAYIRYPLKDAPEKFITVATTRAETMLGDTAVAVNPDDNRYQSFIGKTLILPLAGREIPVIADAFVDPAFGTGAVKVTPAHDPNDFAMGQRHGLPIINIMREDGRVNDKGGEFNGLDRFEARGQIVARLKEAGLLEKVEIHTHAVGHCYRCHTVVEPRLSRQWFVKMEPLARPAIEAVTSGKIRFHPERWSKVYLHWMENIRDWCISRQIWWGHRVPVWYDEEGNIYVARSGAEAQKQADEQRGEGATIRQDPDVLDTWFSSWLWPFATFGWPRDNEDLRFFYPGDALFTASEIIFFWVARMVMAGYEFRGDLPFKDVYIHGTVRDAQGRKMSKSLGNALDPLEIIREYGADALRFSLIINSGQDLYISKEKFETGRNFANKIWNATRLILMNCPDSRAEIKLDPAADYDLATRWIISKYYGTLEKVEDAVESFRFSEAESLIYEFFWSQFCDWYLEAVKDQWREKSVQDVAVTILKLSLKMMHPFVPFVTEEIWENIKQPRQGAICVEQWPVRRPDCVNPSVDARMQKLMDCVSVLRNLRSEWNIKPAETVKAVIMTPRENDREIVGQERAMIMRLARLGDLEHIPEITEIRNAAVGITGEIKIVLPLGELIDLDKEKERVRKQIAEQRRFSEGLARRLENKDFRDKAPKDVVEKEQEKLRSFRAAVAKLEDVLSTLD
jgi:valyl-tRNA synthetase